MDGIGSTKLIISNGVVMNDHELLYLICRNDNQ